MSFYSCLSHFLGTVLHGNRRGTTLAAEKHAGGLDLDPHSRPGPTLHLELVLHRLLPRVRLLVLLLEEGAPLRLGHVLQQLVFVLPGAFVESLVGLFVRLFVFVFVRTRG